MQRKALLGQGVPGQQNAVDDLHIPVKFEILSQSLQQGLGLPGGNGEENTVPRLDGLAQGFPGTAPFSRFHTFSSRSFKEKNQPWLKDTIRI
jgi:hypothetical protein